MHVNIIAECCCNHMGDFSIAQEMIREIKECGADFVKFQKRDIGSIPRSVYDKAYDGPHSFGKTYGKHRTFLEFERTQWIKLRDYAREIGLGFFATPFDTLSAEFLVEDLQCEYIKMGSTQIHDEEMVEWFAGCKKAKIIMSSGMMECDDLVELVRRIRPAVLMQTTSAYPCSEDFINLRVISSFANIRDDMYPIAEEFGLSGHYVSGNGAVEAAAVALGATWIERHFTLDRTWPGSDQSSSLEPQGLRNVVKAVRTVERALGDGDKKFEVCEAPTWGKLR